MNGYCPAAFIAMFAFAVPAVALQPPSPPQAPGAERSLQIRSVERWVQQLDNEIDHLQEDLDFERGSYPAGLGDQAELASRAVTHFHRSLRRTSDREHLRRDFEEMDQQVHQLVQQLEQSGDSWLRRQAARIRYADEQLHFVLQTNPREGRDGGAARELLARHAHVLENETKNLQRLVERFARRDEGLHDAVAAFADEVEHFHQVVEQGADMEHLADDFREVDAAWRRTVDLLNRSSSRLYLRRRAQDVNRVHNQIQELLTRGHGAAVEATQPRRRVEPRRDRPSIEFEIPGVGRFEFPR